MRQWLEAGYFKGDLPISQDPKGPYRTLSSLFPDINVAFQPTGPSKSELAAKEQEEQEAKRKAEEAAVEAARLEREQKEQEEKEARAKAEEAAKAAKAAEAMRLQSEQESQSNQNPNQNQSAQLKMLLGLGGNNGGTSSTIGGVQTDTPEQTIPKEEKPREVKPQTKASKPNQTKPTTKVVKEQPPSTPAPPAAPAWGGAGTNKPAVRKKSMSEIQQEEARVAARVSKQKPSNSGGWANVAASGGTTAWSGSAVLSSMPATVNNASLPQTTPLPSRSKPQIAGLSAPKQKTPSSTQKTMEEFGSNGKMTSALESWCKEQMRKLSGNDDLTLIAFCMTLTDPVEIKGYLTAYLGSTSQVNNFAVEFIQRKNGNKQQEQWETTGGSKKGRKKKSAVAK